MKQLAKVLTFFDYSFLLVSLYLLSKLLSIQINSFPFFPKPYANIAEKDMQSMTINIRYKTVAPLIEYLPTKTGEPRYANIATNKYPATRVI